MAELRAIPVERMPEVRPGDKLGPIILEALRRQGRKLVAGDILVIRHKVVSKAEGQLVPLAAIQPSPRIQRWARRYDLDARVVELGLREAKRVVRMHHGVLITETRHGLVCANSGVDVSNVDGGQHAVLLPRDPDASARKLYRWLKRQLGFAVPVIIADSFGRPWRDGLTEVAIGIAGMKAFRDFRKQRDPHGYRLRVTLEAVADELACMAGLAADKLSRSPVCVIRGFRYTPGQGSARQLIRPKERDLFR